jgi:regulator of protease activity HflC (stomatin/prohibitin superfamily)
VEFWPGVVAWLLTSNVIGLLEWARTTHVVPPDHVEVAYGAWSHRRLLLPGRRAFIPFVEGASWRYDLREQEATATVTTITADNVLVWATAAINFHIVDALRAAEKAGSACAGVIEAAARTGLHDSVIRRTLAHVLQAQGELAAQVQRATDQVDQSGLRVTRVRITRLERVLPETLAPPVS